MVLDHKKCHYVGIGKNTEDLCLANSKEEEILGVTIEK